MEILWILLYGYGCIYGLGTFLFIINRERGDDLMGEKGALGER